ncbi:MAG: DUF3142 domain-containing protein [Pseudomonadota bacterium]
MIRGAITLLLLAAASVSLSPVPAETVDARRYDAFWLWAGVKPQPVLKQAKRIYLLQGQVESGNPVRLVQQRPAVPHIKGREIWMVVRVETLAWPPQIYQQVRAQLVRWRAAGNRVIGIQIDFDARTRHLDNYAVFLADLRRRLPADCQLGITGLLDWSANGDPKGLDALAGTVDEIVLQIYQGRRVIPGYATYLSRLDRMKTPFRIGLLQGGAWHPPATLESNPNFRGYVVFLQNGAVE